MSRRPTFAEMKGEEPPLPLLLFDELPEPPFKALASIKGLPLEPEPEPTEKEREEKEKDSISEV